MAKPPSGWLSRFHATLGRLPDVRSFLHRLVTRIGHLSRRTLFFAVFAATIVPQLAAGTYLPMPPLDRIGERARMDEPYFARIALSLVEEGRYAEGTLRGYRPPGYPAFVAGVVRIAGRSGRVMQTIQSVLFALSAALLTVLAARRWGSLSGGVTGVLIATNVAWLVRPQVLMSETLFLALVVLALMAFDRAAVPAGRGFLATFLAGAVFGASALTREIGLFHLAGAAVTLVLLMPSPARLLRPAVLCLAGALCVVPWALRNRAVFGRVIPVTTNGPINLYMGNNPTYDAGLRGEAASPVGESAWRVPERVRAVWNTPTSTPADELAVMDAAAAYAIDFIKSDPLAFFHRGMVKSLRTWGFVPIGDDGRTETIARLLRNAWWLFVAPLGILGLVRMRRDPLLLSLSLTLLASVGIHFATMGGVNYRLPWEILLVLPAACVVAETLRQRAEASTAPSATMPAA